LLSPEQRARTELIAVSVDDREKIQLMLDRVAREYGPPRPDFTILSDPGHRVIDRYGLLNEKDPRIPHPTVYVIDRSGTVRWKFTEVNYKIRPTNEMILEALSAVQ
jgi:peroxiredoxin